jgi:zinc transporter ZupT
MKKRTLATVLWALTGWYVGALVAWMLNLGPVMPVVLAAGAGAFIWADPRGIIWTDSDRPS